MKKIVFRFWIINLLIGIVLFVFYRIVISQTETVDGNSFQKWVQILSLVLDIGFSLMYLVVMVISSFLVLLNLIEKIRNNFYLSLLTFLGIPSFCVVIVWVDIHFRNLTVFSTIYIVLMAIGFLLFRKRINKNNTGKKITDDHGVSDGLHSGIKEEPLNG